jgi:hypothetical protein
MLRMGIVAVLAAADTIASAQNKIKAVPSIILIITDDQGYGDFAFSGTKPIQKGYVL